MYISTSNKDIKLANFIIPPYQLFNIQWPLHHLYWLDSESQQLLLLYFLAYCLCRLSEVCRISKSNIYIYTHKHIFCNTKYYLLTEVGLFSNLDELNTFDTKALNLKRSEFASDFAFGVATSAPQVDLFLQIDLYMVQININYFVYICVDRRINEIRR